MPQTARTLQEATTLLSPADVIIAAKVFFARRNSVYSAFVDMEGPNFVTLRGAGGEEVVIATTENGGSTSTRVTGSTYLFDQQLAQFLSSLPASDAVPVLPSELGESVVTAQGAQ